ncbi:hypothetical protein [Tenacibaculum sp. 47A_GOM-205m]|uniref:hypothetical protein n=1 Tax=Tenacibaculum sp. 47A_GOM-205m TaxID=1380384 RepID=UPI0004920EF3|nr:hypothetical protein [Tenacibaculum sp. 47A_GOM-205m]
MKKVMLVAAMVFATSSLINASTILDEKVEGKSFLKIEEDRSCVRGCVDTAIDASLYISETSGMNRMDAYHIVYLSCYNSNC